MLVKKKFTVGSKRWGVSSVGRRQFESKSNEMILNVPSDVLTLGIKRCELGGCSRGGFLYERAED